ncbi:MAG: Ig-like domain-containing protein [Lachnospiraceae bacterium]|nr:Ig-like domain-containing protein [Lachnospiraceae bacterium]
MSMTQKDIDDLIEKVKSGIYTIEDALESIAAAAKGSDVRAALYALAYTLNKEGKAGSIDMIARNNIDLANKRVDNLISLPTVPGETDITGDTFEIANSYVSKDATGSISCNGYTATVRISGMNLTLDYLSMGNMLLGYVPEKYAPQTGDGSIAFVKSNDINEHVVISMEGTGVRIRSLDGDRFIVDEIEFTYPLKTPFATAEMTDLRVDIDGTVHDSAGEAVRAQVSELKGDLSQLSEEIASIDLGYDEYGVLHIFINGNPVGDGVQVSAGDFIAVTGLSVSPAEVKFKLSDGKVTLSTIITPENATNKKVIWKSSDTSVATVDNGVITAVANGSTIITASCGGYIASINVNVSIPVPVDGISFDVTEVSGEEGGILNAQVYTITPIDATNRNVIWSSSTPSVATVDAGGKVTCIAEGIAIITVTTEDGGKTASYTLSVGHPETYIKENLLVDYDGINNVGTGVQDTTATVWKDLSGNGYDINLAGIISSYNGRWIESDGFSLGTNTNGTLTEKEAFSVGEVDCSTSGFTVSFVGIPIYSTGNGSVISAYDVDVTSISYYQWNYGVQVPFSPNDPANVRVNCAGGVTLPDECKIKNKKAMLTVVEKPGNKYEIYYNGVLVKSGTGSGTHSMVLKYVKLFDRIQARICHASVYSKALTEDEIAQNFRVFDKTYSVSGISSVSGNYPVSGTVLPYTSVPIASAKIIPTDKASATTVTYTTSNESVVVIDE